MKPRLYMHMRLWYCRTRSCGMTGLGWTPVEAYNDWLARNAAKPCVPRAEVHPQRLNVHDLQAQGARLQPSGVCCRAGD